MKRFLYLFFVMITIFACKPQAPLSVADSAPKNVILLIGDGMGVSQITAGMYSNSNELHLENFKSIGFHKCYSSDLLITDSAAGATALSTGKKTYNGAIGVDKDTVPQITILELAEKEGLATGLVSTSTITHATPAAFIAHQPQRSMYEEIALDFLKTEIDFFVGGGINHFNDRKDGKNLIDSLKTKGYLISDSSRIDLGGFPPDPAMNYAYLTSKGSPAKYLDGRNYFEPACEMAVEFLKEHSDVGFFLMIEGSQIDWGGHDNDQEYIISEMLEFDRVVGSIFDFAKEDGETLVIVTGDHETGGMSINYGSKMDSLVCAFSSSGHTADLIPVFAFGPGAEKFQGFYENNTLFDKILSAYNWQ